MTIQGQPYATHLTDAQWETIEPLFCNTRTYKWLKRELVNAVLYLLDNGCKWRNLPHDFPPCFTVHSFYRRARLSGLWDKILNHLVKLTRKKREESQLPLTRLLISKALKPSVAAMSAGNVK